MADRGLYLLDVTIKPGPYVKDAIDGSWTHLMASSSSNGKVIYGFKVGKRKLCNGKLQLMARLEFEKCSSAVHVWLMERQSGNWTFRPFVSSSPGCFAPSRFTPWTYSTFPIYSIILSLLLLSCVWQFSLKQMMTMGRNVSTVSHSFSWLLAHITCVDTVWNCSCQGVRLLFKRRSSAQELSVTGTLCHNMWSRLHQSIASRIDWTSTGQIWASKVQATRSSSSSIKYSVKTQAPGAKRPGGELTKGRNVHKLAVWCRNFALQLSGNRPMFYNHSIPFILHTCSTYTACNNVAFTLRYNRKITNETDVPTGWHKINQTVWPFKCVHENLH